MHVDSNLGVSRHASPELNGPASSTSTSAGRASPTLAPDSTTTSDLSSALGPEPCGRPYHEQYPDTLPFTSVDVSNELDSGAQQQGVNKHHRMSVDSASEPPSSAVSYGSDADEYTSASSEHQLAECVPAPAGGGADGLLAPADGAPE